MRSGYVLLWRETLERELFREKPFCAFGAWTWLIMEANFEDKPDRFGEIVRRGEIHTSQGSLADAWGWSRSKVQRFLTRLQAEQRIGQETNKVRTKIRITNYESYQTVKSKPKQAPMQHPDNNPDKQAGTTERSLKKQRNKEVPPYPQGGLDDDECKAALAEFVAHRKAIKEPLSPQQQQRLLARWAKKGREAFLGAVAYTVEGGWQGLVAEGTYGPLSHERTGSLFRDTKPSPQNHADAMKRAAEMEAAMQGARK